MLRKLILVSISILFITDFSYAQWGILRRIGISGGINFGILSPSFKDLNNEFKKVDLPEFNNPLFGFGGGGNLTLGGIRIGGFGFGGANEKESKRSLSGTNYNSKVRVDYGVGFGTIGYEVFQTKKFSTSIDVGIGGGSLDLLISDRTSDFNSWDETLNVPYGITNITRKLSYSFFSIQPSLNFEYIYGNFMKFFVSGDYNFILSDRWTKDYDLTVTNIPKMNFNGFSIRAGIYFGLFF